MKKILSILLSFLVVCCCITPIYALNDIEDQANLFNDYTTNLNNIINQYEDIYQINIVVLSNVNKDNLNEYSHNYYINKYSNNDGIIFSFNQSNNQINYYVETFGNFTKYTQQNTLNSSYECIEYIQNTLYELGLQYDGLSTSKYIVDEAALLTKSQYQNLSSKLDNLVSNHNVDIVIYTTYITTREIQTFSDDYYDDHGYSDDGYILVLDMSERYWHISTSGEVIHTLYDSRLEAIENNALSSLGNGYYYNTFVDYLNQSTDYFNTSNNDYYTPDYDNNYEDDNSSLLSNIPIAFVTALLISLLINYGRLRTLKTKKAVYNADNYIKENSFTLTNKQDLFLFTTMHKRRKPENNNRSSGFGGSSSTRSSIHRSSSGRSHGGRGGRF